MRAFAKSRASRAFTTFARSTLGLLAGGTCAVVALAACSEGDDEAGFDIDAAMLVFPDGATGVDATTHADGSAQPDGGLPDASPGADGAADAGVDATADSGVDAAGDAGGDSGGDSAVDAGIDGAPEAGVDAGGNGPTAPPNAPTQAPSAVISLFSTTYAGTAGDESSHVDSYEATCFGPAGTTVADYTIPGGSHKVKEYSISASGFAIVELIGDTGGTPTPPDSPICHGGTQTGANLVNASAMTAVHVDVWTPTGSSNFQIHLVVADATNTIAGAGAAGGATAGTDEASGALTLAAGVWNSVDVPYSSLGPPGPDIDKLGLVKLFSSNAGTFYVDNLYFHQ